MRRHAISQIGEDGTYGFGFMSHDLDWIVDLDISVPREILEIVCAVRE